MSETEKLKAARSFLYRGTMVRRGETIEVRKQDVAGLTGLIGGSDRTAAAPQEAGFDAEKASREELEAEAERRGVEVKGTGKDGNVLVGDLRTALAD